MTVSSNVNRTTFIGSNSAGPFTFGFKFYQNEEITLIKTDTDGNPTALVEGIDYTLTGAGTDAGGVINLSAILPTDYGLSVLRTIDFLQETSFINQGAFYPQLHEVAFDKNVMMIQQLAARITDIETRGYTIELEQAAIGSITAVELDTSLGDVEVILPAAGEILAIKDGADANIVTFDVSVVGQTINNGVLPTLETDGNFVRLALFGINWRIVG